MRVAAIVISLLVFVVISAFYYPVKSDTAPVTVYVNGKQMHYDSEPELVRDNLMVPLHQTTEAMSIKVSWDNMKQAATLVKGETIIKLQPDRKKASRNGSDVELEVAPYIKNGQTYLPFRFLTEAFDYEVQWDEQSRSVSIIETLDQSLSSQAVPVLTYHHLSESITNGATITAANFQKHMEALDAEGYSTITEADLYSFLQEGTPLPDNPILITFDDGYKSNYIYAYPVLKNLDMKATIYLITSRMEEGENKFPGEIPKLSWEEALQASDVFSYQGHTNDSHFKEINEKGEKRGMITGRMVKADGRLETQDEFESRLLEDLQLSRQLIEDKLGQEVTAFAYPFGDYSEDTIKISKKAGFKMAFNILNGKVERGEDLFQLQRISVNGSTTAEELVKLINSY